MVFNFDDDTFTIVTESMQPQQQIKYVDIMFKKFKNISVIDLFRSYFMRSVPSTSVLRSVTPAAHFNMCVLYISNCFKVIYSIYKMKKKKKLMKGKRWELTV